ncbi:MAG: elongation factor EF-2 [Candidatus Bathyarchaeia archaeon]
MPRFKQTAEILKIMERKENIRNIGIIAHIDHGKTTMADSLLAGAGLLSPKIAGEARALDYLDEEQKRGITIKTANISLLHQRDGCPYVINLVDTPGHVDFTGKVTRALRAIDGAVVVVDAVEEVMAQTETVTRQALEERVRPVLFINKVDRLIREMKLKAAGIQKKLIRIIMDFNNLIEIYGEPEFKVKWKVDPQKDTVAFGSALHRWGFTLKTAQKTGIKISDIIEAYERGEHQNLERIIPLHKAILDMVIEKIPNPLEAQKYRLPKIWKGDPNSEIGRAMLNCSNEGPTVLCITAAQLGNGSGVVATGRLFSGSVHEGDHVYLLGTRKLHSVQRVSIYMGPYRENVDKVAAGNIAALSGLETAMAGETVVNPAYRDVMVPFEMIKYVSEPVITVAVEPKNPEDLPRLVEAISRLTLEDPNLSSTVNEETGEYLLSGMGELHLEVAVKFLRVYGGGIEIAASKPMAVYRESVTAKGITAVAKTPNKHNIFWVQVEPLEEKVLDLMEKSEITEAMSLTQIAEVLLKEAGWPREEAGRVLAVDMHKNILLNLKEGFENFCEELDAIVRGFRWACKAGPLCEEPVRGLKVKLVDAQFHENLAYRGSAQIMPAIRRAILGSFLTAKPVILEPIYKIEISVPTSLIGECFSVIVRKRGRILSSERKNALTIITGYIPVSEAFGLSNEMRSATSGRVFWQSLFSHWEKTPENIALEVIRQIRERKGLPLEIPKPGQFMDKP